MKRKMSSSPEIGSTSDGTLGALFDVFLSFRGPDTRTNFTDTLYYALLDKGIRVFIDKKGIGVGEEIGPEIFHAIDDSKICIPIFSKGYASSRWCLRELEHMMQRRKTNELEILPVFYDVESSDVKLETRVYRDALTQHKKECGVETVQGWEDALKEVTKIKGWDAKNKGYGELAHLIARKVSVKLKVSSVYISDELVGTDESVNEIVDMLNVESKDIRIIGIWGMGGIGKTTLAKVVYSKLSTNFESHSFISDIREASKGFGLLNVQRQLISNIIGDVGVELSSIDHGMNMIKDQFCRMKVLIFLDDVDHASQLMALAAKKEWFGMGSRIVVTTRNKSVLCKFQSQFEHCLIYEAKELNNLAALQLFSKHAFRSDSPPNAFLSLSTEVITKTGGLPLAIEVIGSFLCGKTKEVVWQDTLEKMDHLLHEDVKEKLMLSYEKLDHPQKQIFLDIACFLSGKNKSYATYMWDDCGFFPEEGIDVLLLMSLVKIGEENTLWMHDQLKDLGKSIVHQEYYKDPRKGSRVWELGGPDIVQNRKGIETVAAYCIPYRKRSQVWELCGPDIVQNRKGIKTIAMYCIPYKVPIQDSILTSEDLNGVPNIRFLTMSGSTFSGDFGNLFLELRWLTWNGCPKEMQATNFSTKNLVILDLSWSFIDEHWGGWTQLKVATKLKVLNLLGCDMLKETPNLSAFLSLEILILGWCRALTKLPNSIGMLKCLIELDVSYTSIIELPHIIVDLKSLKVLKMNQSYMQKLPEAIGMMKKLEEIYGEHCAQLKMIPSDIVRLSFLKTLKLTGTRVENVPKLPESLVSLYFSSSAVEKVLEIFNPVNLPTLRNLELCFGEDDDETFVYHKSEQQPHAFYSSVHMKLLSSTSVSSFGGWLHCTGELELNQCKNLRQIQQLPSSLKKLKISDCNLSGVVDLSNLENLLELRLTDNRICAIQGLERLKNLQLFKLWMCRFLQTLPNLCNLENLKDFELVDCPRLVEIEGLDRLESLERLDILFCGSLQSLPDLSCLKKLKMSWW